MRQWELASGRCLRVLEGHTAAVWSVAWSPDGQQALSGSADKTVRQWDLASGRCLRVLEGHTAGVLSVAWSPDGQQALSGSGDKTVRQWDLASGRCLRVLDGHTESILGVMWSLDGQRSFSAAADGVMRVWSVESLPATSETTPSASASLEQLQYTNAKVLVVGESGAGKTGLTERLAHDSFTPSYSTSGTWSTQWQMQDLPPEPGWEREVWLWDFGGQADQRLVHQLYVDKTALILLVFSADRDAIIPGLREWQQALARSVSEATPTYLVAGRIDVGLRFDREKVRAFAQRHGYRYFETSALDSRGCPELRQAIQAGIPWTQLERRTSPAIWKLLKDEILRLRDEGMALFTFKELREALRQRLPAEAKFTNAELETVVGLLDGPGVVKELSFGTFILLRPEWINAYAQAVIRTLRADANNLGCLPVQSIAAGKLIFQTMQAGGEIVKEQRLGLREEPIVLQAMEQMLIERKLCLRQEGNLVFPSYCGLEKPMGPVPLKYFISYVFGGFLDDIYATLVVKLAYCRAFRLKELWRDAADFQTLADLQTMGVKLLREDDGRGRLLVHFGRNVTPQEQVIFANYIHEHLLERATETQRLRFYVCPYCDQPVRDSELAMQLLKERGKEAQIRCQRCDKFVALWDALEEHFASAEVRMRVTQLQQQERFELDARRKGQMLVHEVAARINSANQKCLEIPGSEDEGLDMEVEFTDDEGRGTGKRVFLQLKAGNSHLERRASDGAEIFRIKKASWVDYWMKQDCPVLLVIGTFPEEADELRGQGKERFADVRWMEISELLRRETMRGTWPVRQIIFDGERLDALSVRRLRDRVLHRAAP
jgi:small GTP-binding protein